MVVTPLPDPGQFTPVPRESARYLTRLISSALPLESPELQGSGQTSLESAAEKYVAFYTRRYTIVQLPGCDRSIPLTRIYVPLQVIDERSIS